MRMRCADKVFFSVSFSIIVVLCCALFNFLLVPFSMVERYMRDYRNYADDLVEAGGGGKFSSVRRFNRFFDEGGCPVEKI